MSTFALGWAFSLAIFFLGMSAAFAGRLVEKDIHKSSLISCICFTLDMLGTGLFIQFTKGIVALIGIYICYGMIMGIGLGIGYLTPVKTLMLWFKDNKGLATGISIMGFGLAKAIATPIMELIQNNVGIYQMFYILGAIYFVLMFIGHLLLKKPDGWKELDDKKDKFKAIDMFKNKEFLGIWLMFFINIHCGLALITYEKQILKITFANQEILTMMISLIPSITAAFNALGRIGYSTISDKLKERNTIYKIIFTTSIIVTLISVLSNSINSGVGIIVILLLIIINGGYNYSTYIYDNTSILNKGYTFIKTNYEAVKNIVANIINAGYGGGFSTLPALLSERYGMEKISKIHGLALSAWAVAGITGNNMSELILKNTNNNYNYILIATLLIYIIGLLICVFMVKNKKTSK